MSKKKLCRRILLLAVLLACLLCSSVTALAASGDFVKVGLKYGSTAVSQITLRSESGFQLANVADGQPVNTLPLSGYNEIILKCENSNVSILDSAGTVLSASLGTDDSIFSYEYEYGATINVDGTLYRGGVQAISTGGSSMTIINYVSMDQYLYGVVHSEMGQSNPLEALKAQAVTARSFAMANLSIHLASGFNVCTGTHCQVYSGYAGEYASTNQAVDETSGEVMYHAGEPVAGYYYKNSGGYTQNSGEVWNYQLGYLVAVEDIHSPDYPWSVTLSYSTIRSRLEAAGHTVGNVQSVAITAYNSSGAVGELTITGSSGTVTLTKEAVRTTLGASDIKSTHFEVTASGAGGATSGGSTGGYLEGAESIAAAGSSLAVLGADGKVREMDSRNVVITNGSQETSLPTASGSTSSAGGDGVTFTGKGYGHGIGMAQDSAILMAQNGYSYREILEFFYTDITIR